MSTDGEEGPFFEVPRFDWVGIRGGAEMIGGQWPKGGSVELELGSDAWLSKWFQAGLVLAVGLNIEPHGAYYVAPAYPDWTIASSPPTGSSPAVNPYVTLAFHFGLDA